MLEQIIFGNTVKNYILAISILMLFVGLGKLFSGIVVAILRRIAKKTETVVDDLLIEVLEKPAVFALFIVGFKLTTLFISLGTRGQEIHNNIVMVLIVINCIWALNKVTDVLVEHYLAPLTAKSKSKLDDHLLPFVRKFFKVLIFIVGVIFLIKNMGYDVTSLVAGLGIGGLAFALAAQPLLSNLFGGLAIIADKPFQIGDRIRVDQRYEGYVKEMGMRSTVIRTANDTLITIPNNVIATTAIENISATEEHAVRVIFNIGLEYSTSAEKVEEAIEIIKKILNHHKNVVHDTPAIAPFVTFSEFKDSSLNISCGYSLQPPNQGGAIRTEINLEIKKALEKAHIHMAFPTQTLHIKKE